MQTFLPHPNYAASAATLDNARLNKQIVECRQILSTLNGDKNHPAFDMWRGYRGELIFYGVMMYREWLKRGKAKHKSGEEMEGVFFQSDVPWWLGVKEFHLSHQSRLMHKGNVDVLKTRINGKDWLQFAKISGYPNKWYKLTPKHVNSINRLLDELGTPKATKKNHYNFDVSSDLICLWPTTNRRFKYLTSDGWQIYDGGEMPRY